MKKLALALFFILLMAFIIAFNYLLLDRENREAVIKTLESRNADNNASISAQNRDIQNLEQNNKDLQDKITQLEEKQTQLQQDIDDASKENAGVKADLNDKINMLNIMKQFIDIKVFGSPVTQWAEAINAGKYDDAYGLEYNNLVAQDQFRNIDDYTNNLKNTVKSINIDSVELDPNKGEDTGEIYLFVKLEVKLVENADVSSSRFQDGINERYFKMEYDPSQKNFMISEITTS